MGLVICIIGLTRGRIKIGLANLVVTEAHGLAHRQTRSSVRRKRRGEATGPSQCPIGIQIEPDLGEAASSSDANHPKNRVLRGLRYVRLCRWPLLYTRSMATSQITRICTCSTV